MAGNYNGLERIREFWNKRPCNIQHSRKPIGTRGYFDEVERRKYFVEPHIPRFADFLKWHGKKVLELGCGIGTDSINFARAGADLTVVDLSERSLLICQRRFRVYGLQAKFLWGNMEQLDKFLPEQKFDLIYAFGSIHHTVYPEGVLQQLKRYCHPDTEVRAMVYSRWSWKVLVDILVRAGRGAFWRRRELVREYSEAQTGSPETYEYSFRGVRRLMKDFELVTMRKDHIFPYVIEEYKNHRYVKEWYFRHMPRPVFKILEGMLGWHTLVIARPRRIQ